MNDRRRFLQVLGGATVATLLPACGTDPLPSSSGSSGRNPVVTKASAVALGTLVRGPGTSLVGRDAGGLYALTSICTHSGCDLGEQGVIGTTEVRCGCHASRFNFQGTNIGGPAPRPLAHVRLTVTSDIIAVEPGVTVDASVRVAV